MRALAVCAISFLLFKTTNIRNLTNSCAPGYRRIITDVPTNSSKKRQPSKRLLWNFKRLTRENCTCRLKDQKTLCYALQILVSCHWKLLRLIIASPMHANLLRIKKISLSNQDESTDPSGDTKERQV